jgi:hypothetical protein
MTAITDRLYVEHQPGVTHAEIADIVRQCRVELAGVPWHALPELLERHARQRLAGRNGHLTSGRT